MDRQRHSVGAGGVEKPGVTSRLVVDCKTGSTKDPQDIFGSENRKLGHLRQDNGETFGDWFKILWDGFTQFARALKNASNRILGHPSGVLACAAIGYNFRNCRHMHLKAALR